MWSKILGQFLVSLTVNNKAIPGLSNTVLRYVLTVLQSDQTDLIVWKLMTLSDQQAL